MQGLNPDEKMVRVYNYHVSTTTTLSTHITFYTKPYIYRHTHNTHTHTHTLTHTTHTTHTHTHTNEAQPQPLGDNVD